MKVKMLALLSLIGGFSATVSAQTTHKANHLVISEVVIYAPSGSSNVPTQAEIVEIYNPTDAEIDLSTYYLTDYAEYYKLPGIVAGQTSNGLSGTGDFMIKFPTGAKIPAGGVVCVANSGQESMNRYFNGDYANFTSLPGNPQFFEISETNPNIPQMGTNYNRDSPQYPLSDPGTPTEGGNNMSHTDGGENVVLFQWDGSSSLVKDVDMVQWFPLESTWGNTSLDKIQNKSFVPMIGPSNQVDSYKQDSGSEANLDIKYPRNPGAPLGHIIRRSLLEVGEVATGSNGIGGHDETMEENNLTWEMVIGSPSNGNPGVVDLPRTSGNAAPVVGKATRSIQNPSVGDSITVTCPVYDDGSMVVSLMVDKGTGYQATTMTNAGSNIYTANISTTGLAQGTVVKYYVKATDSGGLTSQEADFRNLEYIENWEMPLPYFHAMLVKNTPYTASDLIVSEIMYDPEGTNNNENPQYVELYNPGNNPINLTSFYMQSIKRNIDASVLTNNYANSITRFPEDFIIPAKGYGVIVGNKASFMRKFPGFNEKLVANVAMKARMSFTDHANSNLRFFDCNIADSNQEFGLFKIKPDDNTQNNMDPIEPTKAFKTFGHKNNTEGWPNGGTTAPGFGNTGYSIELTDLTLAGELDGTKWAKTLVYNGTPGAANSTDPIARPGDAAVASVTRDKVYPTPQDSIVFNAVVSSSNPISSVKLYTNTGSGFTATNMTAVDSTNYTVTVGPYAHNTWLKYYVQVEDSTGSKGAYPFVAPVSSIPIRIQDSSARTAFVVNEVMYDPQGSDNLTYPEFVELHNPTSQPMDISYYLFNYNSSSLRNANARVIPEGTIIEPYGYVLLASRKKNFDERYVNNYSSFISLKYGKIDKSKVIELGWQATSLFANSGSNLRLCFVSPNEIDYVNAVDSPVTYQVAYSYVDPWPNQGATAINLRSIELTNPSLDPNNGANWQFTLVDRGTPGAKNSQFVPTAEVNDWSMY